MIRIVILFCFNQSNSSRQYIVRWIKIQLISTTQWIQICDFTGWNNRIVKEQSIHALPVNFLLDPYKRIIAKNIRGQELIDKVKELIKQDEEKEKERKKAERKKKRK